MQKLSARICLGRGKLYNSVVNFLNLALALYYPVWDLKTHLHTHFKNSELNIKISLYTSGSPLLSRIQGYRYHLSKFHMYDTVCLGLGHWVDPEGWYSEGGGRGFRMGNTCTPVADSC